MSLGWVVSVWVELGWVGFVWVGFSNIELM